MDESVKKRVLLVDDEDAILLAFKRILQTPSVEVDIASTSETAKQLLNNRAYAAVITDLRLTGAVIMDGFVVISDVKTLQPDAKIIVITAYGGDHTKQQVLALGADIYLEKPVSPGELKGMLASMGVY